MTDDRLQRMMDDPERYFAECEQWAREMVERDIAREMARDHERCRAARRALIRRWLRWWSR